MAKKIHTLKQTGSELDAILANKPDGVMSDTSDNSVSNRVVKAYIDGKFVELQEVPENFILLKTINGQSIFGAGNISITGGGGAVTETIYNLYFTSPTGSTTYISKEDKAEVKFSFISQVMRIGTSDFVDTGEAGIVTISVKKPTDAAYREVKTMTIPSNIVQTIDLTEYLGDGTNLIKITGIGETTGRTADNIAFNFIRSSLSIETNFDWWNPRSSEKVTLPFYIGGTIDKTLHVTVRGADGYSKEYSKKLGTTPYTESVATIIIDHPGSSGVYTISSYVASNDGNFRSSVLDLQMIFAVDGDTGTYMVVNNILPIATNYSENSFFDFAIYGGGSSSAAVTFDIRKDGASVYSVNLGAVTTGSKQTFSAPLEIATSDSSNFNISLSATSHETELITPISIEVDNSYSFAAFPGAVFVMNPKTRDNSQSNRNDIINEVDGSTVTAEWSGMNWGSDGYQTVGGVKVLRIFAESSVSINYQPFKTEAARSGKTIILDLLFDNVVDYEDAVLSIVKNLTASWLGVKITPEKMTVFSSLMGDEETQSFKFEDRTRIRLSLVVMPDAYGNSGFNLVVLYVNGTKNREFTYANTDSFVNEGKIIIGSDSADIDTYAIMVYDEALSSDAIHQNHTNLLDTIEEKRTFRDKNDVLAANGVDIDFEKVKGICNVVEFEPKGGLIPSLANPNKVKADVRHYWCGHPEWDTAIFGCIMSGQGTSARLYYDWNQKLTADSSTVTQYADGSTTTGPFRLLPGKPLVSVETLKLNWASMPQCNKMGSVNSINDLSAALNILDADGNPTAIWQRPFVGFVKTYDDNGNPVRTFCGLYTVGPDKGDPNWFNYDYDRYPDLISVEGADNASAGALFKVPWNPKDGRWQFNMDEESMQYNGINAFDYNAGRYKTKDDIQAHYERIWKPVYDFVYQCSPNIAPFPGTLAELNAQASVLKDNDLEYWLDGGGLYYYESSLGQYIPSDSGSGQMNLFDQLVDKGYGVTSAMLSGLTTDEVNTYLKVVRTMKFKFEADRYFHLAQGRFAVNWNLVLGSTDTRTKNTYWTVRGLLSEGYRCTLYWDDTDTIGPFTNQGQDRKPYWAEVGDKYADGSPVWNGEQNRFYNLMELAFPDELADDMRSLLNAMVELGGMTTGNKSDQLYAFFHKYYFSQAQEYFPSALYNAAAKRLYERAKLVYGISYNNDTDPITQMLGDYYSGWKRWIKRRIQYIQSKYHWGDYSGASGDVISVRAAGQSIDYQITPAIWMYPVIMNGTSPVRGERTGAGQVCNMTVDLGGAADQQNTIKGVHYLQDIGAWHDKQVHGTLSIYGRMLRELHIGHPTADIVITITKLVLGETPSLRLIDLRRVSTLAGALDLSSCTHLQVLHAQGTSLTSVTFPNGGPLASVGFPATMQQILLKNFPKLYNEGVDISQCKGTVTDFMIVGCDSMKPLALLAEIIKSQESQGTSHALKRIRATGIDENYDSSDMLDTIVSLTDGTYEGLDANGIGGSITNPVLEGKVSINANAYQDTIEALQSFFGKGFTITITGQYFLRIVDEEVLTILLANGVGDGIGITQAQAAAVTDIKTWFKDNIDIVSFDELRYFTALTALKNSNSTTNNGPFKGCTSLVSVAFPSSLTTLAFASFYGCASLQSVGDTSNVVSVGALCFRSCPLTDVELNLPSLTSIGYGAYYDSKIAKVKSLGSITIIPNATYLGGTTYGVFSLCVNLAEVSLPSTLATIGSRAFYQDTALSKITYDWSKLVTLGENAFYNCTSLIFDELNLSNLTSLGQDAFYGVKIKMLNLGALTSLPNGTSSTQNFGNKETLEEVEILDSLESIPDYSFYNYINLKKFSLSPSVKVLGGYSFKGCESLNLDLSKVETFGRECLAGSGLIGDLSLPSAKGDTGYRAFYNTSITSVSNLGNLQRLNPYTSWASGNPYGTFESCTQLKTVVLPETLTTIGPMCFYNCASLETMNFPQAIEVIGEGAFRGCSALEIESLRLPNLIELGNQSFLNCKKLKRIDDLGKLQVVPATNASNASYPFVGCESLEFVRLPSTVTTLGTQSKNPFHGLNSLKTLICEAVTPPTLSAAGSMPNTIIYVPDSSVQEYKVAQNWSTFASRIYPISLYNMGGIESLVKYDRLVGDASDYVNIPIAYKAGWSYKYSVNVIADLIDVNTKGSFAGGGITIFHSTYREARIDVGGTRIWNSFSGLETLEFKADGVYKNGTSISTAALSEDATTNIVLFSGFSHEPNMGNFVHFRSLEVWNEEGTLIHKYVPCKMGEAIGLFDEVGGTFSPSANGTLSVENDE